MELKAEFGPGEPCGEAAWAGADWLRMGWGCSTWGCLRLGASCRDVGCCLWVQLATWARGDFWKVGGWKALSGVEELRVMGGPRSASRWGLLLRIEEEGGGTVVAAGGAVGVMDWVKPGSSWVGGGPVYGLSKSPPNSMSWLLMSCSMSENGEKSEPPSPLLIT